MVSPVAVSHLLSTLQQTLYDFDPDVDTPVDVAWVDMRDFSHILVGFMRTVGTGALDTFQIIANNAADGSGTDVVIVVHAVASEPDAVGDQLWLECSEQQIAQEGEDAGIGDLRYVSANIEFATLGDEGVVSYARKASRFARLGLTVDIVA